jgi:hypothetical protein
MGKNLREPFCEFHFRIVQCNKTKNCSGGRTAVSQRWSERAMEYASNSGHIHVLRWWKESGLEMRWSGDTFLKAWEGCYGRAVKDFWDQMDWVRWNPFYLSSHQRYLYYSNSSNRARSQRDKKKN